MKNMVPSCVAQAPCADVPMLARLPGQGIPAEQEELHIFA